MGNDIWIIGEDAFVEKNDIIDVYTEIFNGVVKVIAIKDDYLEVLHGNDTLKIYKSDIREMEVLF